MAIYRTGLKLVNIIASGNDQRRMDFNGQRAKRCHAADSVCQVVSLIATIQYGQTGEVREQRQIEMPMRVHKQSFATELECLQHGKIN